MDASRVLGTLRAHCDRLEMELSEIDADLEEATAMVTRNGPILDEPRKFLQRLRAAKAVKLHETEQSLLSLASSYDKGASLLAEFHSATPSRASGPWSTIKANSPEGKVRVVTTTSPILQFSQRKDIRVYHPQ
mmetsp:Transcript_14545/g.29080  ORF Transcript_14545/g.29080 Transcript_14545/m.29080 type:complete len:133 (-) Transcript_14545:133-531(-)